MEPKTQPFKPIGNTDFKGVKEIRAFDAELRRENGSFRCVRFRLTMGCWFRPYRHQCSLSSMIKSFPGGSGSKESAHNVGDLGLISGLGRPPGGEPGNPLQYSSLENPHRWRSLAGYSPWGRKELDTTERLTLSLRKTQNVLVQIMNISYIQFFICP